jgi:hypothetical protein
VYKKIDNEVRLILVHNGIHLQPACKERLYLPRIELGRGSVNIEHRSEIMLLKLFEEFTNSRLVYKRRAAILKVQEEDKTHFWTIKKFCEEKYKSTVEMKVPLLQIA